MFVAVVGGVILNLKHFAYHKSSNTSRASNTGRGSKHVVLIEAGPRLEAGPRIGAGFRGLYTNNLNTQTTTFNSNDESLLN